MDTIGSLLEKDFIPKDLSILPLEEIQEAANNLKGVARRTPLIPLDLGLSDKQIYLKLENLQMLGAFKVRGAYNAMCYIRNCQSVRENKRVYTISSGNFAQGLGWSCRKFGIHCTAVMHTRCSQKKQDQFTALGGQVIKTSYEKWLDAMRDRHMDGVDGYFVHPTYNTKVIAGNGTIGLEIVEDLPDVDHIITAYGGGALSTGIASAVKQLKPEVSVYACEPDTNAPLAKSFQVGYVAEVADAIPNFLDGSNAREIIPGMWNMVHNLVSGSIVVSLQEVADAIKLIVEKAHVIAEGSAGAPVAAALKDPDVTGNIVCVISGGNLDIDRLITILQGQVPNMSTT